MALRMSPAPCLSIAIEANQEPMLGLRDSDLRDNGHQEQRAVPSGPRRGHARDGTEGLKRPQRHTARAPSARGLPVRSAAKDRETILAGLERMLRCTTVIPRP